MNLVNIEYKICLIADSQQQVSEMSGLFTVINWLLFVILCRHID